MHRVRIEYPTEAVLDESTVDPDPFVTFDHWLQAAMDTGMQEPNAMALATAGEGGKPSVRTVLLKDFDSGFVFYTNYRSRKGRELESNPNASLLFLWLPLFRQIEIEGTVARVSEAEADEYFASRPPGARLGAHASRQSEVIPGRKWLEDRFEELRADHPDGDLPRPSDWGGYRLTPTVFEFWQGRANRLHDRIRYTRSGDGWSIDRLSP